MGLAQDFIGAIATMGLSYIVLEPMYMEHYKYVSFSALIKYDNLVCVEVGTLWLSRYKSLSAQGTFRFTCYSLYAERLIHCMRFMDSTGFHNILER